MKQEDSAQRSRTMAAVKSINTKPELFVRKLLFKLGYRYRLHQTHLPGKPDIVFPGRKKIIFIHGCFWHGHNCKRGSRKPSTRQEYWLPKIERNQQRDNLHIQNLKSSGWSTLVLWECKLKDSEGLTEKLKSFLT